MGVGDETRPGRPIRDQHRTPLGRLGRRRLDLARRTSRGDVVPGPADSTLEAVLIATGDELRPRRLNLPVSGAKEL